MPDDWAQRLPLKVAGLIMATCYNRYCLPSELLDSSRRAKHITAARREIVTILRSEGFSAPTIGRWLQLDHSSVYHLERTGHVNLRREG